MSAKVIIFLSICLVVMWFGEGVKAQYWEDYYHQFEPVVDPEDLAYRRNYMVSFLLLSTTVIESHGSTVQVLCLHDYGGMTPSGWAMKLQFFIEQNLITSR